MLKDCPDASDSVVLHFARGYTFVMQIETVSDTYHRITFSDGSQLFLVGTAHVSSNSVDQVKAVIEEENPDTVCIELDAGRMQSKQSSWQDQDIRKVFKEKKGFLLLSRRRKASFFLQIPPLPPSRSASGHRQARHLAKSFLELQGLRRKREYRFLSATGTYRRHSAVHGQRAACGTSASFSPH